MSVKVDFNCDLGEGFGTYRLGNDEEIMPYISSANIACGFHAGDPVIMKRTVSLAEKASVAIGAHPSFPDLQGFGRRDMQLTPEEIRSYTTYQIGALKAFTRNKKLQHVKAHGALYNMAVNDEKIARAFAEGVYEADPDLILVGLAGSVWLKAGKEARLRVASEVFADRALSPDGTLVPRSQPGSIITDEDEVVKRALKIITEGKVAAINGKEAAVKGDTICLHGDTPGAAKIARKLYEAFRAAGVQIAPMGSFL